MHHAHERRQHKVSRFGLRRPLPRLGLLACAVRSLAWTGVSPVRFRVSFSFTSFVQWAAWSRMNKPHTIGTGPSGTSGPKERPRGLSPHTAHARKSVRAQPGAAGHIPCDATATTPVARLPTPPFFVDLECVWRGGGETLSKRGSIREHRETSSGRQRAVDSCPRAEEVFSNVAFDNRPAPSMPACWLQRPRVSAWLSHCLASGRPAGSHPRSASVWPQSPDPNLPPGILFFISGVNEPRLEFPSLCGFLLVF
jgi:hypothetical protein